MRRFLLPPVCLIALALGAGFSAYAQDSEDAVYVYDLFHEADNCLDLFARLRGLSLRPTVILSVEQGPEFILDQPSGEGRLACVLRFLNGSRRRVKALFLQDPVFLERRAEAVRRAARLGEFIARHPQELAGVQMNVEPHGNEQWPEADSEERRRLLEGLHELLRRVRPHLGGLPLSIAVPWWYADLAREIPPASPTALFQVADELYLMAYGDGNPTPAEELAGSLRARLGGAFAFSETGLTHVVLATHEFRSAAHLEAELGRLRRSLASSPNFAGTAVFHATSGFQAATVPPRRPARNR